MEEVELTGGQINLVVRVGDTVRHPGGPWTATIHALLHHLRSRGFTEAPEPLGLDEQGRSVLRYVEGDIGWWPSDDRAGEIGDLVRRYHQAVADFVPPEGAVLRFRERWPGPGEVLGHHDIAPWNVVVRDDAIVALLDWDMVGGAPPSADLAYAAWRYAALGPDEHWHAVGRPPGDRVERLVRIVDAYGLEGPERIDFVDAITTMLGDHHALIHRWADAGHSGFIRIVGDGSFDTYVEENRRWLDKHRTELVTALR